MMKYSTRAIAHLVSSAMLVACNGQSVGADAADAADAVDVAVDVAMDVAMDSPADVARDVAPDVADVGCPTGQTTCGGHCVDLQTSGAHCGACDMACATGHSCVAGACLLDCASPNTRCGSGASMSCVDAQTDVSHCGSCANACPGGANAAAACTAGICALACNAGYSDCDGDASNGCEANIQTDGSNCNGCGIACPTGQMCVAGECRIDCPAPATRCGSGTAMACVDTQTDAMHCGSCTTTCPAGANASPVCGGGTCAISCSSGFGDCDANAANGCEHDVRTDDANCGGCGVACGTPAHGTSACVASACVLSCDAGFADCNGDPSDGCEASLNTTTNCRSCGRSCGGTMCVSGECDPLMIANVGSRITGLDVAGGNAYFVAHYTDSTLYSVPVNGSAAYTPLSTTGFSAAIGVVVDSGRVYIADYGGTIGSVPVGGGTATTESSGLPAVGPLLVEPTLFVSAEYAGVASAGVFTVSRATGTVTMLGTVPCSYADGIVRDASGDLLVSCHYEPFVYRIPAAGGAATLAYDFGTGRSAFELARDGTHLFAASWVSGEILDLDMTTSTVRVVAQTSTQAVGIAVTPTHIVWTDYGGAVWSKPR